ncbi:MAG TPA: hypothetical protein VG737_11930, partial [Cyclobacteriaceae bacterium]|nr:hypothetical protein [Cyclobacteriaceae bacterium]
SFAWQHEFCAFNTIAKTSPAGRDIRLANGNVASRILPVKIHDLDADDTESIEKELNAPLRAIEFIYREPGVNRPLRSSEEDPSKNLAQTVYRNQLNKVAQAIKQIIAAMKEPAHKATPTKEGTAPLQPKSKYARVLITSFVVLALIALGYLGATQLRTGAETNVMTDKSIAVLPFVNMSNDPDQEYFSDGISEEVLNLLAKLPELRVVGRTSSFSFKGKNEDLRDIGKKLGVAYLLEGSVRKFGNKLRITGQLIQVENGSHLWSDTYDRELNELFAIQDEIASQVVEQLKIRIGVIPVPRQKNIDAHKLLLESRFIGEQNLPGASAKRRALMKSAIAIDSTDAELWTELANACNWSEENSRQREQSLAQAKLALKKALTLDPELAAAHYELGMMAVYYDWDWQKGENELTKAAELDQRFKGATYRINIILGRFELALADALNSLKYDPLNPQSLSTLADVYNAMSEPTRAIECHRKLIELTPFDDSEHCQLAIALALTGSTDEALKELDKVYDRNSPRYLSYIAQIYSVIGDHNKSNEYLNQLISQDEKQYDNSIFIATVYSARGDIQRSITWLETAYERKNPFVAFIYSLALVKGRPGSKWIYGIRNLRNEPRFRALLRKLNFPDTFDDKEQ